MPPLVVPSRCADYATLTKGGWWPADAGAGRQILVLARLDPWQVLHHLPFAVVDGRQALSCLLLPPLLPQA
jgi:hypothetical protein